MCSTYGLNYLKEYEYKNCFAIEPPPKLLFLFFHSSILFRLSSPSSSLFSFLSWPSHFSRFFHVYILLFLIYIYCITYTNTLASASEPALAINGLAGWNATSKMLSSNFLRCAVISCTHVLLSMFHNRILQSWPSRLSFKNVIYPQISIIFFANFLKISFRID